jgi:hypothetical protein
MKGGCFCGAVKFSTKGPTVWCSHCHCSMCQRSHGAGVVTWVGCRDNEVELDDSDGKLRWFPSSGEAERGFCSHCGSSLFFRSSRWPGELHIARALFAGELDREPANHAFYDTHVDWMSLADQLPGREDS